MSGTSPTPTQAGFTAWIRSDMQISTSVLPDNAVWITYAYNISLEINDPCYALVSPLIYMLMVYNLGGDNLVNYAQDTPPSTFFTNLRATMKIGNFVAGVITSASDNGTSESIEAPDFMKQFTLANLQNLKTPWGRTYLQFAQRSGTIWGLT